MKKRLRLLLMSLLCAVLCLCLLPEAGAAGSPAVTLGPGDGYSAKNQVILVIDSNTAILPSDIQTDNNSNIKQSFLDAYVKNGEPYAYYYVTPCWQGAPATPISDDDLAVVGPFTFDLDLPEGVTSGNFDTFDVHVYHYVKSTDKWEEVDFALVPGTNTVRISNFSRFSPFAIVALPGFTVNFASGDHGTVTNAPISGARDTVVTLPEPAFAASPGWTFAGWKIGGDGEIRDPGYQFPLTKSVTVTAQWKRGCTVSFDNNDSGNTGTYGALVTGEMTPMYVSAGETAILTPCAYLLTNHAFRGWSLTPGAGNPVDYEDGAEITPTGDMTLYAVWERTHVTILYNANGGTGGMSSQTAPVGGSVSLMSNGFASPSDSKMFAGWSTRPSGNVEYAGGETIDVPEKNITLYAVWREKVYLYFKPGSSSGTGSGTEYYQIVPSGVVTQLAANRYSAPTSSQAFAGWSARYDGGGERYVDQGGYSWTGDTYLYAQWGRGITVTYDKNAPDASGTMTAQRVAADASFRLSKLGFTNSGSAFLGWSTVPGGGGPLYTDREVIEGGFSYDTTLYARWEKRAFSGTVTITGSVSGDSDMAYVGETLTAGVTGESVFTDFSYQWKLNGRAVTGATGVAYTVRESDFACAITCEVTARDAPDQNTRISNTKYVGIEQTERRIVNNGAVESACVYGVLPGMYYSVDNASRFQVTTTPFELTRKGVYRFYLDSSSTVALATVDVVNWWTVGYGVSAGSGTVTAKSGGRTLSANTTISESGVLLLQPYSSVGSYDHVWIIREGSGLDFSVTVRPGSGSYRYVMLNNSGSYDSGSTEKTYTVSPVTSYAMLEVAFRKPGVLPQYEYTLTLPASLTVVGEEAFAGGAFDFVKLSENTVSVGKNAFANCSNLRGIYIPGTNTQIDPEAFGNRRTLTVFGKTGSTAEAFALDRGFAFEAVS